MCLHLWCATPAFVIRQRSEQGRGDTKAGLTPQSHVFQRCCCRPVLVEKPPFWDEQSG